MYIEEDEASNFRSYFDVFIAPAINELESKRYKLMREGTISKFVFIGAMIAALIYGYFYVKGYVEDEDNEVNPLVFNLVFILFSLVILLTIYFSNAGSFVRANKVREFRNFYKFKIFKPLIKQINPALVFQPYYKTNEKVFMHSKIFGTGWVRDREDDGIIGNLEDFKIRVSEFKATYSVKHYFEGLFFTVILKQPYKGKLMKTVKGLECNELEDNKLNVIKSFENIFGKDIYALIDGTKIFLGVPAGRKLFEAQISKKQIEKEEMYKDANFLFQSFRLVEQLLGEKKFVMQKLLKEHRA